jgi:hypothetical protein
MFVGLHALAAVRFDVPELMISDDEGAAFMRAAQNVARHYSVETTQKTLDWIALIGTTAGIYGTRIASIGLRRRSQRSSGMRPRAVDPQPSSGEVVPFQIVPTGANPDDEGGFAG